MVRGLQPSRVMLSWGKEEPLWLRFLLEKSGYKGFTAVSAGQLRG